MSNTTPMSYPAFTEAANLWHEMYGHSIYGAFDPIDSKGEMTENDVWE